MKEKNNDMSLFPSSLKQSIGSLVVKDLQSCIDEFDQSIKELDSYKLCLNDDKFSESTPVRRSDKLPQSFVKKPANKSRLFPSVDPTSKDKSTPSAAVNPQKLGKK